MPFDFSHLVNTIDEYSKELMSLIQTVRETTDLENRIISSGGYITGEDPTKKYLLPSIKSEVPYLDFSPLQNAINRLGTSVTRLNNVFQNNIKANNASAAFNQSLYRAERQLLIETGLPRRAWYKHSLYAPGFYTGYGVKTMPGIREAIEQRNWKEAQDQIEVDAKALIKLAEYFNSLSS